MFFRVVGFYFGYVSGIGRCVGVFCCYIWIVIWIIKEIRKVVMDV